MELKAPFILVVFMTLLNGGVLGLVHRGLLPSMRPSAKDWRMGSLLMAAGIVLLIVQTELQPGIVHPLSHACVFLALTLYWRSLRRLYGAADHLWLFAPALLGAAGIYWYSSVAPSFEGRALVSAAGWALLTLAAAWTLHRGARSDPSISRRVLAGIFWAIAIFSVARLFYFAFWPNPADAIRDPESWMSVLPTMATAVVPVIGTTAFLLLCFERMRRRWEEAASTDELTALANRRAINSTGAARFEAARAGGAGFAAAIADVDHFKNVNDQFGHDVGDLALKHIAGILEKNCRGANRAGRQGGEEFVVLFENANASDALNAAERLRQAVEANPLEKAGGPLSLTVSIGVAVMSVADQKFEDMLHRADQALYAAKAGGRNCVKLSENDTTHRV